MQKYTPEELRLRHGYNHQAEAADAMGISRSYYNEIERGVRVPSYKMAQRIARFYRVRIDEIRFPAYESAISVQEAYSSSHATSTA